MIWGFIFRFFLLLLCYSAFFVANQIYHEYWGDKLAKFEGVASRENCYMADQDWAKGKWVEPPSTRFQNRTLHVAWADCDYNGRKFTLWGLAWDDGRLVQRVQNYQYLRPYKSRPATDTVQDLIYREKIFVSEQGRAGLFFGYFSRIENFTKPWLAFHAKPTFT